MRKERDCVWQITACLHVKNIDVDGTSAVFGLIFVSYRERMRRNMCHMS
jgi:hypothetical protein